MQWAMYRGSFHHYYCMIVHNIVAHISMIIYITGTSHSEVILNCGNDEECLEQTVMHRCATMYPPLRWRLKGGPQDLDLTIESGFYTSRKTVRQFSVSVALFFPFTSQLTFPISVDVSNLVITCSDATPNYKRDCLVKVAGTENYRASQFLHLHFCIDTFTMAYIIID